MARQDATRWKPDTCGCEFFIRTDALGNAVYLDHESVKAEHRARIAAGDPTANRDVSGVSQAVNVCPDHAQLDLSLSQSLSDVVSDETRRKNIVFTEAQTVVADLEREDYEWSFDNKRVLVVKVPKMTGTQKADFQIACNTKYGAGKVKVSGASAEPI